MARGPRLGPCGTPCGFQIRLQRWPSISLRTQLGSFICTPRASTVSPRPLVNQAELAKLQTDFESSQPWQQHSFRQRP